MPRHDHADAREQRADPAGHRVLGPEVAGRYVEVLGGSESDRKAFAAAVAEARNLGFDAVIVDSAGRLHIDDELMVELEAIKASVTPWYPLGFPPLRCTSG